MKKLFALTLCLLQIFILQGQNLRCIKENFDENKFNWDELSTKDGSAFLTNGKMVLTNKSSENTLSSICNLPVLYDEDFTVTTVLDKPEINDKDFIGIVFNYEDEENFWVFLVREKESYIGRYKDGKYIRVRTNPIILKKGKKNDVTLEMKKKGKNIIFSVDNMEIKTHPVKLVNNTFGFIIYGKGELRVSALEVKQYERNN